MFGRDDDHHILFYKDDWISTPEATTLRTNPVLIPRLYRPVHDEIHPNCGPVPLLNQSMLRLITNRWEPDGGNVLSSIDRLIIAIDRVSKLERKTITSDQRELAQLAIHAIEAQIPYLRDNIIRKDNAGCGTIY